MNSWFQKHSPSPLLRAVCLAVGLAAPLVSSRAAAPAAASDPALIAQVINPARGALVDEAALVRALEQKTIAGAAVDAFTAEPLPNDHPLRRCPNVLLTPHQAFNGRETGERVSLAAAQAIVDLMHGKQPTHVVNGDVFQSTALRAQVK